MSLVTGERIAVDVAGVALGDDAAATLVDVVVAQRLSMPAQCVLTFIDPPPGIGDVLTPGAALVVQARGRDEALFIGEITAVDRLYRAGGGELRVRAYDLLHRLRKRQPVRAHVQVALPDLARELVSPHGIDVVAEVTGPLFQRIVQHRQTDFDLLAESAERCGLWFTLRDRTLRVLTLEGIDDEVPLALGEALVEARIEVNGESACRAVDAIGWDPHRVTDVRARVEGARSGRDCAASAAPDRFGADGSWTLVDATVQAADQAEALAQAVLDRRVAAEVVVRGLAEGDARIRPGARVRLERLAAEHSGTYVVANATHRIDAQRGWLVEFDSEPPPPRPRSQAAVAAVAKVSAVDDPDALGRVKVVLPTYGGVESDWLGVTAAGAGSSKGLICIPNVGDQVLVLLVGGDPSQGVVIGGLYGCDGPPEATVEGGAVRRFGLITAGGQRVLLDDHGERLRLVDQRGSFIELGKERLIIHAEGVDLVLEAPGKQVLVRGKAIDFASA